MQYAVVDVETTGLHPRQGDQILEIAIWTVDDSDPTSLSSYFHQMVRPKKSLHYMLTGPKTKIHGITRRELRSCATFEYWASPIYDLLKNKVFVAHNVNFDAEFINVEFERLGLKAPVSDRLCTGRMAAELLGDPRGYTSLKKACESLGIPLTGHHTALCDSEATAQILQRWLNRDSSIEQDRKTLLELIDFSTKA